VTVQIVADRAAGPRHGILAETGAGVGGVTKNLKRHTEKAE